TFPDRSQVVPAQDRIAEADGGFFASVQRFVDFKVGSLVELCGQRAINPRMISMTIELHVNTIVVRSYAKISSNSFMAFSCRSRWSQCWEGACARLRASARGNLVRNNDRIELASDQKKAAIIAARSAFARSMISSCDRRRRWGSEPTSGPAVLARALGCLSCRITFVPNLGSVMAWLMANGLMAARSMSRPPFG